MGAQTETARSRPGGSQLLSVLLTVALVCGVLGAVGYGVYQFRIRSAMHQEIRAIMRQYMPLQVCRPCRPQGCRPQCFCMLILNVFPSSA